MKTTLTIKLTTTKKEVHNILQKIESAGVNVEEYSVVHDTGRNQIGFNIDKE